MTLKTRSCLGLAFGCLALLMGCSDAASGGGTTPDVLSSEPDVAVPEEPSTDDALNPQQDCLEDSDCEESDACQNNGRCEEGSCVFEQLPAGTDCGSFCNPGVCSEKGNCELQSPYDCPDLDGNLCTLPKCDLESDQCVEDTLPNGAPPYASNDCYVDPICIDGIADTSQAGLSELAKGCEDLTAGLDPLGCIERYECVGGDVGCEAVYRPQGAQCWSEGGSQGNTCIGHSCLEGECVVDSQYAHECEPASLGEDCDAACQACTELTCSWIEDPGNPTASALIPYCQPSALVGEPCNTGTSCSVDQACVLDIQSEGPLGKETLGLCTGGEGKTPEMCAAELGLNPLPCVLAGMECGDGTEGCVFNEEVAKSYCSPPSSLCFEPNNTYCSHLDVGENWNSETGCHVAWANVDCDDGSACTVDSCSKDGDAWTCSHDPVEGAVCDDGDPCTSEGLCADGQCEGIVPLCPQGDGNPCVLATCEEGECGEENASPGTFCDDGDPCSVTSVCGANGQCEADVALPCDDGNACTVDGCDPLSGCFNLAVAGDCDDGDDCTTGDSCLEGVCTPSGELNCNDDNLCTEDSCSNGVCVNDFASGPCDDGSACTLSSACSGGECVGGTPLPCEDDNVCTLDGCDALTGCFHVPQGGVCDDGNACTDVDTCSGGACTSGANVSCDDGNACTDDTCDTVQGCQFTDNDDPCDDGDSCTGNDACVAGTCTGIPGTVSCTDFNSCTEDICLPSGDCAHNPIPDGFPCDGGGANSCQGGQCVCVPQCDGTICDNADGCGGICGCGDGETCAAGKCVLGSGDGGDEYDGVWAVSGDQGMVGNTMTLDFDAATNTVTGNGVIAFINVNVDYTGTYNHPNFTLEGTFTYSLFGGLGGTVHNEVWDLTLNSLTNFTGTLDDSAEVPTFNVVGTKIN